MSAVLSGISDAESVRSELKAQPQLQHSYVLYAKQLYLLCFHDGNLKKEIVL